MCVFGPTETLLLSDRHRRRRHIVRRIKTLSGEENCPCWTPFPGPCYLTQTLSQSVEQGRYKCWRTTPRLPPKWKRNNSWHQDFKLAVILNSDIVELISSEAVLWLWPVCCCNKNFLRWLTGLKNPARWPSLFSSSNSQLPSITECSSVIEGSLESLNNVLCFLSSRHAFVGQAIHGLDLWDDGIGPALIPLWGPRQGIICLNWNNAGVYETLNLSMTIVS